MLPDFESLKERRYRLLLRLLTIQLRFGDKILRQLRTYRQPEGRDLYSQMKTGEETHITYNKRIGSKFVLELEDLPALDNSAYLRKFKVMAEDMQGQQVRQLFQLVDEVTEKYGMVVHGKGKSFSEQFLECIQKVQIDFDERGQPHSQGLYMHPDTFEKLKDEMMRADSDPEVTRAHDEIMKLKYIEWRDREADRKLVD